MYTLVYIRNKELRLAYTLVINQLDYWWHSTNYKDLYTKPFRGGSLVSESTEIKWVTGINYTGRDSPIDDHSRNDGSRPLDYFTNNDPTGYDPVIYCSIVSSSRLEPSLSGDIDSGLYFKMVFAGIRGDNRRGSRLLVDYVYTGHVSEEYKFGVVTSSNMSYDTGGRSAGIIKRDYGVLFDSNTALRYGSRLLTNYLQNFYEPDKILFYVSGLWLGPNGTEVSPPSLGCGIITSVISAGVKIVQRGSRYHSNIKNIRTSLRTYPYTLFNIHNYLIG